MMVKTFLPVALALVLVYGCTNNNQPGAAKTGRTDSSYDAEKRTGELSARQLIPETFNQEDIIPNDYLKGPLATIRGNFKRVNSITNWDSVVRKDLDLTTERGEVAFYYLNGHLEKIVASNFGETFQQLDEYYLLDNKLSFVFEKSTEYNRPVYYDSAAMKENNDNQPFDIKLSEITEERSYFINNKLVHLVNNQDCGSPFSKDYLSEKGTQIKKKFDAMVSLQ